MSSPAIAQEFPVTQVPAGLHGPEFPQHEETFYYIDKRAAEGAMSDTRQSVPMRGRRY